MKGHTEKSIGVALFVTVGTVFFGDFAQDVAGWIVCRDSDPEGKTCKDSSRATAIMIATAVSTMVAIFSASFVASRKPEDYRGAILATAGALIGAYFTILKAAAEGAPYPLRERLDVATYIYLVIVFSFSWPAILASAGFGRTAVLSSFQRLAVILLVGACLGFATQILGEVLWPLLFENRTDGSFTKYGWGGDKFVVAPVATVALAGAWGAMMLDPWLRPTIWAKAGSIRMRWFIGYFFGAVLLAAAYGWMIYFGRHGDGGWLTKSGLDRVSTAAVFMALILPGLWVFCAVSLVVGRPLGLLQLFGTGVLSIGISVLFAGRIGRLRADAGLQYDSNFQHGDISGFIASHALAAAGIGVTIVVANHLSVFAERRFAESLR